AVTAMTATTTAVRIATTGNEIATRYVINCGGLHADRIAAMMGVHTAVRIIPFRGEYYTLRRDQRIVRGLIYPVPDPAFPFLGVHFTRRISGDVEAGPNAVLAFAREGYRRETIEVRELLDLVAYRGFWMMARRYWRTGLY